MHDGPAAQRFERLIQPTLEALHRFAHRLERDPVAADDLLQQSLLAAFRKLGQLKEDGAFKVWASRILFHTHLNRRKKRVESSVDPSTLEHVVELDERRTSPEALTERSRLGARLASALDALPEPQRAALWLVDGQGFTFAEAAGVLGVPIGTTASRVARARTTLRTTLADVAREQGVIR